MRGPNWFWGAILLDVVLFAFAAYMAISAAQIAIRTDELFPALPIALLFGVLPVFCVVTPFAAWRAMARRRRPRPDYWSVRCALGLCALSRDVPVLFVSLPLPGRGSPTLARGGGNTYKPRIPQHGSWVAVDMAFHPSGVRSSRITPVPGCNRKTGVSDGIA